MKNQINSSVVAGFNAGLEVGAAMEKGRILGLMQDIHIHNEHGAIVYLEELHDLLEVDSDQDEADLP